LILGLFAGLLYLGCPAPVAQAQEPPRPAPETPWSKGVTAEQKAAALALNQEAADRVVVSEYAKAAGKYQQALKHWDHPLIRFNLAYCLINLERPLEAHENLLLALKHGAAPFIDPRHFQDAGTYLRLLEGRLTRLKVKCGVAGAQVSLDGKPLFVGPGETQVVLLPGDHQVVVSKPGFVTVTRSLVLHSGRQKEAEFVLVPLALAVRMKRRWAPWKPWVVLGAGVLVAAASVPLLILSKRDYESYDVSLKQSYPQGVPGSEIDRRFLDTRDRARSENIAGVALLSLGGTALAASITMLILNVPRAVRLKESDRPRVTVRPALIPGGGMGFAELRF
jgi:tetratricopeptide (TPR) repeat protein